jgi:hypothetical protein
MWQVKGTGNVYAGFWRGDAMQGHNLEDMGIDANVILE